jgi:hypothetical protein
MSKDVYQYPILATAPWSKRLGNSRTCCTAIFNQNKTPKKVKFYIKVKVKREKENKENKSICKNS